MITPISAMIPFQRSEGALGSLTPDIAAKVVAAASDIALVVDRDGVVRDVSVNTTELAANGFESWLDRSWIDTVSPESRHKVVDMLQDAVAGASRWREVNHPVDDGATVLIRYFALDSGEDGQVIVIGRDMRATTALQQRMMEVQQSVERDYLRLRQAESRYRLLFQTASEAVLIVDASTRRVRESNPAASRLTERAQAELEGQPFVGLLDPGSVDEALRLLNSVQAALMPPPPTVRLAGGMECALSASLFRQDRSSAFLVRLTPQHAAPAAAAEPSAHLNAVLERISDAFVVTDPDLRILTVNPAFLDLVQLASREQVHDQSLDRFLGRPHIDLKVMLSQLRDHGSLRNFATVLRGRYGAAEEVEVSAVAALDAEPPVYGFSVRSVGRRLQTAPGVDAPRSVEQLTQLIGRVPMKEIVRESTDLIERLCIEAALTLTSNNRASAADILGLSRQSLYSKLNRYGLGSADDTAN